MFDVDDALDAIFLGAFLFGLLFTALSLLLGAVDLGGHHGGDVGHDGDAGHHGGSDGSSHVNLSTTLAFIAWFGGVGYLAHNGAGWTALVSVLLAVLGGLAGAYLIYLVFARVIRPGESAPLDPRDFELQGKLARVSSSVLAGGTGEITYVQHGSRMVRAARAADGRAIPRGTEVIVLRAERGVGIVAPWDELVDGDAPPRREGVVEQTAPDQPAHRLLTNDSESGTAASIE
jgi:hypothetical protein